MYAPREHNTSGLETTGEPQDLQEPKRNITKEIQNVLVARLNPIHVKISDFGLSREADRAQYSRGVGTVDWMAPEIAAGSVYNCKVDIWSLGILIYKLLTRTRPPIGKPTLWRKYEVSKLAPGFVESLIDNDPFTRPTAAEALGHAWILYSFPFKDNETWRDFWESPHWMKGLAHLYDLERRDPVGYTALLAAAFHRDVDLVKCLLDAGADIAALDDHGCTALHTAGEMGNLEIADCLLSLGADIAAVDSNGYTPLHRAVDKGHVDLVKLFLRNGSCSGLNIEAGCDKGKPLHLAVIGGHEEVVRFLLDRGANVNSKDSTGRTALHLAAEDGDINGGLVKLLIEYGANIHETDQNSQQPLHYASVGGNCIAVTLLLRAGAKYDFEDRDERLPLHLAAELGNTEVVNRLLQHTPGLTAKIAPRDTCSLKDLNEYTATHLAAMRGHLETMQALLNTYPGSRDEKGHLLRIAAKGGYPETIKCCLESHPMPDIEAECNDHGMTALLCAVQGGKRRAAELLLKRGAKISATDKYGNTILHHAVMSGDQGVMHLVLGERSVGEAVDVEARDFTGRSALHLAAFAGNLTFVGILLENNSRNIASEAKATLHSAAAGGHVDMVHAILNDNKFFKGPEIAMSTDPDGATILHIAAIHGHTKLVEYLLRCGADAAFPDLSGLTALHHAAREGQEGTVTFLVSKNPALASVHDHSGCRPIDLARRNEHLEVCTFLESKAP